MCTAAQRGVRPKGTVRPTENDNESESRPPAFPPSAITRTLSPPRRRRGGSTVNNGTRKACSSRARAFSHPNPQPNHRVHVHVHACSSQPPLTASGVPPSRPSRQAAAAAAAPFVPRRGYKKRTVRRSRAIQRRGAGSGRSQTPPCRGGQPAGGRARQPHGPGPEQSLRDAEGLTSCPRPPLRARAAVAAAGSRTPWRRPRQCRRTATCRSGLPWPPPPSSGGPPPAWRSA